MVETDLTLAAMAEALAKSADYRVLRRLVRRETFAPSIGQSTKAGILLDVETTGLDQQKDEVIELGIVKFDYLPDGRIARPQGCLLIFQRTVRANLAGGHGAHGDHKRDDRRATDQRGSRLVVRGRRSDRHRPQRELRPQIRGALLADIPTEGLGCSATEVEWRKHGFEGSRLGYLLNGAGFFHQAHRAVDDYHALLEILAFELPTGAPALAVLLEQARKKTMRVWAEQSPFDLKDSLKRRGYRWSDGRDSRPRSWYVDVDESKLDDEIAFLKTEIYLPDVEPRLQTLTAFDRFSIRA